jgi:Mg2+ and Co2+ transporter CorA
MEASKRFAEKAEASTREMQFMTEEMNALAQKTKQETVSMRIITLVTLFFLPGTFISVYFPPPYTSDRSLSPS